ncbi:sulfurtransferase [Paenibacillaceae bacterium]|nr:sulfurtransferase [Paenibacillaceae bacterium]
MSHLVQADWLYERLNNPDIVIFDARFNPGHEQGGLVDYEQDHIPGAVYVDLRHDLTDERVERSFLPDADVLSAKLSGAGVNRETTVVIYGDGGNSAPFRLWWLLQYWGHKNAFILDGGYSSWKRAGYPLTADVPVPRAGRFKPVVNDKLIATAVEIRDRLPFVGKSLTIIDARQPHGEPELPWYKHHIPGAVPVSWKELFDVEGNYRSQEEIRRLYDGIDPQQEVILYCGRGVGSCPAIFALHELGYRQVRLYAGSWSDWSSDSGNPVAVGEE